MTTPKTSLQAAADRKARRKDKAKRIAKQARLIAKQSGYTSDGKTLMVVVKPVKIKALKDKLKTELHAAIRDRDGNVCISCGRGGLVLAKHGTWHAGHLFGVGPFPALQFHPLNIHSQGACCNTFKHGNHAAYSAAFIRRHGLETFQALDAIKSEPRQWRIPDLLDLRAALARGLDSYSARYFELTGWKVLGAGA